MSVDIKEPRVKASIALGQTIAAQGFSWKLKAYLRNIKIVQEVIGDVGKFAVNVTETVKEREKLNLALREQDLAIENRKITGLKTLLSLAEEDLKNAAGADKDLLNEKIKNLKLAIANQYSWVATENNYATVSFSPNANNKIKEKIEEVQKLSVASKAVDITFGVIDAIISAHYKYTEYKVLAVAPNPVTSEMLTNLSMDRGRVSDAGMDNSYFDFDLVNYSKYRHTRSLLEKAPEFFFGLIKRFSFESDFNKLFDEMSENSNGSIELNTLYYNLYSFVENGEEKYGSLAGPTRDAVHDKILAFNISVISLDKTYIDVVNKYDNYDKTLNYLAYCNVEQDGYEAVDESGVLS